MQTELNFSVADSLNKIFKNQFSIFYSESSWNADSRDIVDNNMPVDHETNESNDNPNAEELRISFAVKPCCCLVLIYLKNACQMLKYLN